MKRRKLDTRLDWRDPDMPVYRNYRFANGQIKEFVEADYERRYREHMLSQNDADSWRYDPTYNIRRKR